MGYCAAYSSRLCDCVGDLEETGSVPNKFPKKQILEETGSRVSIQGLVRVNSRGGGRRSTSPGSRWSRLFPRPLLTLPREDPHDGQDQALGGPTTTANQLRNDHGHQAQVPAGCREVRPDYRSFLEHLLRALLETRTSFSETHGRLYSSSNRNIMGLKAFNLNMLCI